MNQLASFSQEKRRDVAPREKRGDRRSSVSLIPKMPEGFQSLWGVWVKVNTKPVRVNFGLRFSRSPLRGASSVEINVHQNRTLFPVEVDERPGEAKIPPTKIEIWRVRA